MFTLTVLSNVNHFKRWRLGTTKVITNSFSLENYNYSYGKLVADLLDNLVLKSTGVLQKRKC